MVREFQLQEDGSYVLVRTLTGNENAIGALVELPASGLLPDGGIASAGYDRHIRVWAKKDDESLTQETEESLFTLSGHELQVCALAVGHDGTLLSSSWDGTVRVWQEVSCERQYKAHENAVWDVKELSNGVVVTVGADRLVKLWKDGELQRTLNGHTDVVRSIAEVPGIGFLTASNDTTIILWNYDGDRIRSFTGHLEYIYQIKMIDPTHFASVGEDKTLCIWDISEEAPIQRIEMPGMQWTVAVLPNGDIATGGGDGVLRVWTAAGERFASQEMFEAFTLSLEQARLEDSKASGGGIDVRNVPDRSALQVAGTSDGETKLVREGAIVRAYKWSEAAQEWDLVGDVVDASANMVGDQAYDHVIDVVLEGQNMKLGHNNGENPFVSAQRFIDDNDLDQQHHQEVADFIIRNVEQRQGQTLSTFETGRNVDPFTGSSAYAPPAAQPAFTPAASGRNFDPFTGDAARSARPARPSTSSASAVASRKHFPVTAPVPFRAVKVSSLKEKLFASPESATLSAADRAIIAKVLVAIGEGKHEEHEFTAEELGVVSEMKWADENNAPVLDLCRSLVLFKSVGEEFVLEVVSNVLVMLNSTQSVVNQMLGLWTLANALVTDAGRQFIVENASLIEDTLELMAPRGEKKLDIGIATVLLNLAVCDKQVAPETEKRRLNILLCLLKNSGDDESKFRCVCAMGTMLSRKSARENRAEMRSHLAEVSVGGAKGEAAMAALRSLLGK